MPTTTPPQPSFSPRRKWTIAFNVTLTTLAVLAVLIGINYLSLSSNFSKRFYLSSDTRVQLSPRTIGMLKSLTNQVTATIYYDKEDPLYPDIVSLLREYQAYTKKLTVKTIDYYSNLAAAAEMKAAHPQLGSLTNRDFIMFECEGRLDLVDGNLLKPYKYDLVQTANANDPRLSISRKQTVFNGEMYFTAKIFGVTQSNPLKAYFLQGHKERSPAERGDEGYYKVAEVFHRNHIVTDTFDNLFGTNTVPLDCSLLVIAGPQAEFQPDELEKISQYLDQGGRLFALFDAYSLAHSLGLEGVLAKWNVKVTHSMVLDSDRSQDTEHTGSAFSVTNFAPHDVTKSLAGSEMEFFLARPIERIKAPSQTGADEPQVTELAFSSVTSRLRDKPSAEPAAYPLMVAVEKVAAKGVLTERGTTRMVIVGDSILLDNKSIPAGGNEDFADAAINWLLERTSFLSGVGPRPITEYRLQMTPHEINVVKSLLLVVIPGGILLFGGLVWLRRRR